jgi:hypothetical protein
MTTAVTMLFKQLWASLPNDETLTFSSRFFASSLPASHLAPLPLPSQKQAYGLTPEAATVWSPAPPKASRNKVKEPSTAELTEPVFTMLDRLQFNFCPWMLHFMGFWFICLTVFWLALD